MVSLSDSFCLDGEHQLIPKWLHHADSYLNGKVKSNINLVIIGVPSFGYALLFIPVVGLGSSAGVMALGFESIGMIAKLFIEAIEDLDMGVIEAMDAPLHQLKNLNQRLE